ncbi:MAG: site-2 protease family protein [Phycisphaeraceae bacterium]|nr:site-2 protease family protein [Phycisphaeraceae bacterium]MCW5754964.1 site-2 protease family protein [Phycisphaeraceae bacterium]
MSSLLPWLATLFDLFLVVLGFGLIIVIHELGHFLAARWAGVRVLAFAVGIGKPVFSYRRGIGWRRGSSEPEYLDSMRSRSDISPTEYRFCWLPFGGYVKMLGQEDANPGAVSSAPDSYQNCPIWKRMIIISAGVIANVITAMLLFVFVFMVGLKSEPARIGGVVPGHPASQAIAENPDISAGLLPGDEVAWVDGRVPRHFNDLNLAVVMAARNEPVRLRIRRDGYTEPLAFNVTPKVEPSTGLLAIGVTPARSTRLVELRREADRARFEERMREIGLEGVEPGMRLVEAAGRGPIRDAQELLSLARASQGTLSLTFENDDGRRITRDLTLIPELEIGRAELPGGRIVMIEHLAGLTPVMRVADPDRAQAKGLRQGDIFLRIGAAEYPGLAAGIREIQARKRGRVEVTLLRDSADGVAGSEVSLSLRVNSKGQVGFGVGDTADISTLLARTPEGLRRGEEPEDSPRPLPGSRVPAGSRILSVDDREVSDFASLRAALIDAANTAKHTGDSTAHVSLTLALPGGLVEPWMLTLEQADIDALRALSWRLPFSIELFELEQTFVRGADPVDSILIGLAETRRVMITTYLTFARLFQGTVKVEHLKGPVGIAHLGTRIAERGTIWLLFFMGLVSINLAVINFLPLPLVDGGQFLMLVYEQVRGRPVPLRVQEVISIAGLLLIGAMFLIVTYNDIMGLFAG